MINSLTFEQEQQKVEWQKEWFKIGSSCEPADKPLAEETISSFYALLKRKPPQFIWVSSPQEARKVLKENNQENNLYNFIMGQENSYWVNFYLFIIRVLKVKPKKDDYRKLCLWENISKSCFWWWPFENVCIISDRPEEIHWNDQKVLHNANGPSVRFRDGWELYMLNGVKMTKEDVMTPANQLNAQEILKRQNVDQRRELIRKVGIESMLNELKTKVIDTFQNYQLLTIELSDQVKDAKFLKMKNPSIGIWHVEGVARECNTVQEALNWRAGDIKQQWKPVQLT